MRQSPVDSAPICRSIFPSHPRICANLLFIKQNDFIPVMLSILRKKIAVQILSILVRLVCPSFSHSLIVHAKNFLPPHFCALSSAMELFSHSSASQQSDAHNKVSLFSFVSQGSGAIKACRLH